MKKSVAKENAVSLELVLSRLRYESATGKFFWLKDRPRTPAGSVAGSLVASYWRISINHRKYLAHRLAWFVIYGEWPVDQIDHINGCKTDNRIHNLRCANASENQANISKRPSRKSDLPKGVSFVVRRQKWSASIKKNGKSYNLGYFESPENAQRAYVAAAKIKFGEFARVA